jgi:hypothetical protein
LGEAGSGKLGGKLLIPHEKNCELVIKEVINPLKKDQQEQAAAICDCVIMDGNAE